MRPIPRRLRADFDPGDHLHPNDAGYQAMADAFDLEYSPASSAGSSAASALDSYRSPRPLTR